MNVDMNMLLCENSEEDTSNSLDTWAGVYKVVENNNVVVVLFESSQLPGADDFSNDPELEGAINYTFYHVRKRRGRDKYWISEKMGGFYLYHQHETLLDFMKWLRDTEGYTMSIKETDIEKYDGEL